MLENLIKKITGCTHISYAQNGEDIFLTSFFKNKSKGIYVDVGAHHPLRFSNTYLLYKKGWNGINIDVTPGTMQLFNEKRPRDINIETAVSDTEQSLTLFSFQKPALNTLSLDLAKTYEKQGYPIISRTTLQSQRLDTILDKQILPGQNVSLLSVDVEGLDLEVLRSNNWQKYRPELILAEDLDHYSKQGQGSALVNFLSEKGYTLINSMGPSLFFKANK